MAQNYILLETINLTQSAASVTFDNIPQTGYTDLKVVMSARTTQGDVADGIYAKFNGSAAGFTGKYLLGNSSTASSGSLAQYVGEANGNASTASTFSSHEIHIPNYTSANNKSFSVDSVSENNLGTSGAAYATLDAGLWSNTAAITSITLTPSGGTWVQYSTFSLYALAALGTTPVTAPLAFGGNIVANDGTYWYHAFLSSGTFTPATELSCDALVIGGGGSGGGYSGAGGGAGGAIAFTSQSLSTAQTVTIGAGGVGTTGLGNFGTSGSNSVLGSLTAGVGGGSGAPYNNAGTNGGSGGGGGAGSAASGSGFAGGTSTQTSTGGTAYGFAGGTGGNSARGAAGGGGGAGALGGNAGTSSGSAAGGNGGIGISAISWSGGTLQTALSTLTLGQLVSSTYYIAAGGGGCGDSAGTGGSGGGGTTVNGSVAGAGIASTGSGGGGANNNGTGGNGGSGVVIIRYAMV